MEQTILRPTMLCFALFLLCFIGGFPSGESYKNYTVGGNLGWFDKTNKPDVDFDKWVSGKTFSLGDFLIFNTDSNHSVIQTHNLTTFNSCDSQGDDDIIWSTVDPNSTVVRPITVPVPLLKEGPTYFFSGDYDGEQCINGQKFEINVTHGQGLPPSLRDNPDFASNTDPAAPGPANPDAGNDQSAPDTVVSTDFSHPKNVPKEESSDDGGDDDGEESDSKKSSGAGFVTVGGNMLFSGLIGGIMVLFWVV